MELSKILKIILKLISKCSSKNKHVWCNNIIINEKIMYAWFPIFFIDISSSLLKILLGIVILCIVFFKNAINIQADEWYPILIENISTQKPNMNEYKKRKILDVFIGSVIIKMRYK